MNSTLLEKTPTRFCSARPVRHNCAKFKVDCSSRFLTGTCQVFTHPETLP